MFGERCKVYGIFAALTCCIVEIVKQTSHVEGSYRRREPAYCFKTNKESLISCNLVFIVLPAPVTFAVKPYIPVAEILSNEILDSPSGTGQIIVVITSSYFFY